MQANNLARLSGVFIVAEFAIDMFIVTHVPVHWRGSPDDSEFAEAWPHGMARQHCQLYCQTVLLDKVHMALYSGCV